MKNHQRAQSYIATKFTFFKRERERAGSPTKVPIPSLLIALTYEGRKRWLQNKHKEDYKNLPNTNHQTKTSRP